MSAGEVGQPLRRPSSKIVGGKIADASKPGDCKQNRIVAIRSSGGLTDSPASPLVGPGLTGSNPRSTVIQASQFSVGRLAR